MALFWGTGAVTPDPLKVIDAIQAVMAERLKAANVPISSGFGGIVHQKLYQLVGYQTAWAYCEAKDDVYAAFRKVLLAGGYEV